MSVSQTQNRLMVGVTAASMVIAAGALAVAYKAKLAPEPIRTEVAAPVSPTTPRVCNPNSGQDLMSNPLCDVRPDTKVVPPVEDKLCNGPAGERNLQNAGQYTTDTYLGDRHEAHGKELVELASKGKFSGKLDIPNCGVIADGVHQTAVEVDGNIQRNPTQVTKEFGQDPIQHSDVLTFVPTTTVPQTVTFTVRYDPQSTGANQTLEISPDALCGNGKVDKGDYTVPGLVFSNPVPVDANGIKITDSSVKPTGWAYETAISYTTVHVDETKRTNDFYCPEDIPQRTTRTPPQQKDSVPVLSDCSPTAKAAIVNAIRPQFSAASTRLHTELDTSRALTVTVHATANEVGLLSLGSTTYSIYRSPSSQPLPSDLRTNLSSTISTLRVDTQGAQCDATTRLTLPAYNQK